MTSRGINYKQLICIQYRPITNEQVKLISFITREVDFTLLILNVTLLRKRPVTI